MSKLSEVFWSPFQRASAAQAMERLQNFREDETGGRDRERYSDERVNPNGWMKSNNGVCKKSWFEKFEKYCK